jgi:hypothetical protein
MLAIEPAGGFDRHDVYRMMCTAQSQARCAHCALIQDDTSRMLIVPRRGVVPAKPGSSSAERCLQA